MSTEKPLEVSDLRPYPSVSVIIPMFNEELVVKTTIGVVFEVVVSLPNPDVHEVVCVNDGSADGTLSLLRLLAKQYPKLRVVNLSRNFGHQAALTAGMDYAGGDVLFVIDGDLQDDPWVLTRFIDEYRAGADVVYAQRIDRKESWLMRAAYSLHYRLLASMSSIEMPVDAGDFALLSREVADAMRGLPERNRYLRGLRAWVGYKQVGVPVERRDRAGGRSKYSLRDLIGLALDGILAFSIVPLRIATALGALGLLGGLLYAVFALVALRDRIGATRLHHPCAPSDRFRRRCPAHVGSARRVCGPNLRRGEGEAGLPRRTCLWRHNRDA